MRNEGTDASKTQPIVPDKLKCWGEKFFKEFCSSSPSLGMDGWGDV